MTTAPAPVADLQERVTRLESHVAHLEAAHQDMSEMLARQWDEIDRLTRTVKMLHDQLAEALPTPEAQKPPHY